jgi:hypothetical protein
MDYARAGEKSAFRHPGWAGLPGAGMLKLYNPANDLLVITPDFQQVDPPVHS